MGTIFVIDVAIAAAVVGLWYFCFARYNRRKGTKALHWVESACSMTGISRKRVGCYAYRPGCVLRPIG